MVFADSGWRLCSRLFAKWSGATDGILCSSINYLLKSLERALIAGKWKSNCKDNLVSILSLSTSCPEKYARKTNIDEEMLSQTPANAI